MTHCECTPARQPRYADPEKPLSAASRGALVARGVGRLFVHQAQALDSVMAGARLLPSWPLPRPRACMLWRFMPM